MLHTIAAVFCLLAVARGQQVGTQTRETHPKMSWQKCTAPGSCTTQQGSVVLDSNWRWLHTTSGYDNCYTGNEWDAKLCPDAATCSKNCAVDGADYTGTYGIQASGSQMKMTFVTEGEYSTNIGSRVYLMDTADSKYALFQLKNNEFTFDVDVSKLPCGLNGALYFVEMDADGGVSKAPSNKAGAKYGTGYCDAQCPHDLKFINGEANVAGWKPSETDPNAGTGNWGTCCAEMDIWEANSISTAYTPHPCNKDGQYRCEGTDCGDTDKGERYQGVCDKDGCDFNSFRLGEKNFYGEGLTVDTKQKMTVVTQFFTANNQSSGALSEIRRIYVQGGKVIQNTQVNVPGVKAYDSIVDGFCDEGKVAFGDNNDFKAKGGMAGMGKSMEKGMVLVMSMWADHAAHMLWLDSNYPLDKDPSVPGVARGICDESTGVPDEVVSKYPSASVIYSNIKFGPIGSTYASR